MTKLLRAGYNRYLKSIMFYIALVASAIIGIVYGLKLKNNERIDEMFIVWLMFIFAAVISLSVGREYSDGGFRNKLIAGYKKSTIFFSEYISASSICLLFFVVSTGIFALMSLDDIARVPAKFLLWAAVVVILCVLSMITLLTVISISIPKKALSAVIALSFVMLSSVLTLELEQQLQYREFTRVPVYDENGRPTGEFGEEIPNPKYVGGAQRKLYEFAYYTNPCGQLEYIQLPMRPFFAIHRELLIVDDDILIETMTDFELYGMPFISLGVIITVAGVGLLVFRKKNIK